MRSYKRLKVVTVVILCGYAVAALAVKATVRHSNEVFPLFSWSLFSQVPAEDADYGVRIVSVAGKAPDPPPFHLEAQPIPGGGTGSIAAYITVQRLGEALEAGDAEAAQAHRRLLEEHHLRGRRAVRYEVVHRTFNTLERWSSGRFKSVRTVAVLLTDGPGP